MIKIDKSRSALFALLSIIFFYIGIYGLIKFSFLSNNELEKDLHYFIIWLFPTLLGCVFLLLSEAHENEGVDITLLAYVMFFYAVLGLGGIVFTFIYAFSEFIQINSIIRHSGVLLSPTIAFFLFYVLRKFKKPKK